MNLDQAKQLAESLMEKHGLKKWGFEFDRGSRRFGCCKMGEKKITLSKALTELNEEVHVKDVILHEIAHALCPSREGHGPLWKRTAREIGATPERCFGNEVITPPRKYLYTCPTCGHESKRHRKIKDAACDKCCRKYNGGKYSEEYLLTVTNII